MSTPDWAALRQDFPTLERWTYLDVARKTIAPRCQAEAMADYTRDVYENAGADAWSATNIANTREKLAALLGAKPAEIAFTKNTTEGLNIAAHGFDLKAGDNVVLTNLEHVANVWVWKHWEAKGVEIRYAQHRDGRLPVDAFVEQIDARTRVVSTAYVTYGNGYRVDLPALGRVCRERDIRLVVDGVQAAGILAQPLSALGADVIAIGGHKGLFGLTGSGIVYCREALVDALATPFVKAPAAAGSPLRSAHANSQFDYVRVAHRFEGGNPNFLGVRVLDRGAAFLQSIGLTHVENRVRELSSACLTLLNSAGLRTQTPDAWEERAHIVNVIVPNATELMQRLFEKHRVVVNVKDDALRVSMSFFNNEADLEKAVWAIKSEAARKAA
ncbi:MAG TPA: aminotransferase class V-fold PLP-dependent enzyme [Thermoanaerobaculia bacterium]|nr:aminotransferase class V-fold PLP-dependent enzyme [Burkholderiales bacterium]HYC61712.1 aminotransferase class V-fold PLP-dependent enzyme [Thermoanaerobaculia bacterium]